MTPAEDFFKVNPPSRLDFRSLRPPLPREFPESHPSGVCGFFLEQPNKNLKSLENIVNIELQNLHEWLTSNKLTLNTTKTNFVIFHPYQKKVTYQPSLYMFDNEKNGNVTLESKNYIKCLGVLIDKNLNLEISH